MSLQLVLCCRYNYFHDSERCAPSLIAPQMVSAEAAWKDFRSFFNSYFSSFTATLGISCQILVGQLEYRNDKNGERVISRHMQVHISVLYLETSHEDDYITAAINATLLPKQNFQKVPGWVVIGIDERHIHILMDKRFDYCTYHKNRHGGDPVEDGSGRIVNRGAHTARQCICTKCEEKGHSRFDCKKLSRSIILTCSLIMALATRQYHRPCTPNSMLSQEPLTLRPRMYS